MKSRILILWHFIMVLLFCSCGRTGRQAVDTSGLTGEWTLVELKIPRGTPKAVTGIMEGRVVFQADGTYFGSLLISKQFTQAEEIRTNITGKWSMKDGDLVTLLETSATSSLSKIWFEREGFLAVEPRSTPGTVYYYKKSFNNN
jgi:hypothetical protein